MYALYMFNCFILEGEGRQGDIVNKPVCAQHFYRQLCDKHSKSDMRAVDTVVDKHTVYVNYVVCSIIEDA